MFYVTARNEIEAYMLAARKSANGEEVRYGHPLQHATSKAPTWFVDVATRFVQRVDVSNQERKSK